MTRDDSPSWTLLAFLVAMAALAIALAYAWPVPWG